MSPLGSRRPTARYKSRFDRSGILPREILDADAQVVTRMIRLAEVSVAVAAWRPEGSQRPRVPVPELLKRMRGEIGTRQYSHLTEKSYMAWVQRFLAFSRGRHPEELGAREISLYLSHLATVGEVSAATQNQALSALLFFFRDVLKREPMDFSDVVRAKQSPKLPCVLTKTEVTSILG